MADDTAVVQDTNPTEDQVKAANAAEDAKWADDFPQEQLVIKSKREDNVEETKDAQTAEEDGENLEAESEESSSDGDDNVQEEEVSYSEPAPVVTVDDPGEYTPGDYSFEIDIKGKKYTVESLDQAEQLAEDHADDLTAKQLFTLVSKGSKIELKQERDKEKWEAAKATYDEQAQTAQARQDSINNMAAEFDYLVEKGLLPRVANKYKNADWQDPEVAKQAGIKEQVSILNYMVKENELRAKAGVKPLASVVDAFNAWKLEQKGAEEKNEELEAAEVRKAAGSRVAGVSPSQQQPYVPKGIAVGRTDIWKRNQAVWDD